MREKEIAELRRRFRLDKSNITHIRGCCVNEKREIVAEFNQSLSLMPEEEAERLLAMLKRSLSGTVGKNLIDLTFTTAQVAQSEEHGLLMALRNSALEDEEAVQRFFEKVIGSLALEGNYLILMAHDVYDVPYRAKDGEGLEDASSEQFSYILCSICPVKLPKPVLSYYLNENQFRSSRSDWVIAPPELGFLFPAFDDRSANLYNCLYYSKNAAESHAEFVETVFCTALPLPAEVQKETFAEILEETLAEDCSMEVVQAVQDEFCGLMAEHKASGDEEPLLVSRKMVERVLDSCGVAKERISAFSERYDQEFGEDAGLSPRNLIDTRQLAVSMPDVKIQVNPERSDLVETRIINGTKYILVRADESVEVNGVSVHIDAR